MITFNTENDGLKKDEQDEPEISVAETGSTMESIIEAAEEEEKSKAVSQSDKKIEELVKTEFIKENREKGGLQHNYDVVIGFCICIN